MYGQDRLATREEPGVALLLKPCFDYPLMLAQNSGLHYDSFIAWTALSSHHCLKGLPYQAITGHIAPYYT